MESQPAEARYRIRTFRSDDVIDDDERDAEEDQMTSEEDADDR